jgi:hypothetical protein
VTGGQGDMLLATLAQLDLPKPPRARKIGVTRMQACGANDEVLKAHRLDGASLAADIAAMVKGR